VTRIDDGEGKKQFYQSHWNGKEWVKGVPEEFRVRIRLYRISDAVNQNAITQGKSVLIVEGEGIVDVLLEMGIAATCSIGGAGKWRKYGHQNYLEDLKGAKVVLCPDRDKPGINHCLDIEKDFPNAQWLYAYPDSPDWLEPPTKEGLDIADWVHDHKLTSEQIIAAIEPKRKFALEIDPLLQMKDHNILEEDPDLKPAKSKKTSGELLLEIAEQGHYFHTPDKVAYVDVSINGVRHTLPLRGKDFKGWLRHQYFCIHGKGIGSEILNQVLGVLEAKACFEGGTRDVYLRLAWHQDKIYLDLGTEDWSAVEIDENGWRIVTDYPVRFRRPKTLLPLFQPDPKGRIADLRPLLNVDDDNWVLVITFLLFCLYPRHPHPVLFLTGEQGVGKSFAATLLKSLGDPGKAPLIPAVADLRNLAIQAQNRWIVAYDNLSYISVDQSDAVCRISTGGGFSTRALFENDEEVVFEFIRELCSFLVYGGERRKGVFCWMK